MQQAVLFVEKLHPDLIPYIRDGMIHHPLLLVPLDRGASNINQRYRDNLDAVLKRRPTATGNVMLGSTSALTVSMPYSLQPGRGLRKYLPSFGKWWARFGKTLKTSVKTQASGNDCREKRLKVGSHACRRKTNVSSTRFLNGSKFGEARAIDVPLAAYLGRSITRRLLGSPEGFVQAHAFR